MTKLGMDLVDIARFEKALAKTPKLLGRLFFESEQTLAIESKAARFAVKEALKKAVGNPETLNWNEIEVTKGGKPRVVLHGDTATRYPNLANRIEVSISHDAGIAGAVVIIDA
jgi:holo-[acyl-carrier protein] synthase